MDLNDDQKRILVKEATSELVNLYKQMVANKVNELLVESLVAYPGENQRADYYSQGFRHGKVVGMNFLIEEINNMIEEAKNLQTKK
jgi:hypothetical protein